MIRHYERYDEYKATGLEWLPEVPGVWRVKRLKYGLLIQNGRDYKHVEVEAGYPVIGSGGQFTYASEYLHNGEAVLLGRKGTIDKPLYVNCHFWTVDTMYYGIPNKNYDAKFIYYSATTIPFSLYSTSTALPSITQSDLGNHTIACPSTAEQKAIATFLDEKTATIDTLLTKLQKQKELLTEKRVAIITQVVTRGLNPNVPMKATDIEWLPIVPAEWSITQIKKLAKNSYKAFTDGDWIESNYITDSGIRLIQTGNIGIGKYKEQGHRFISEETFKLLSCTEIISGNVLICRLAAPVGRACIAPKLDFKMITSVDVCILNVSEQYNPYFITYFLSSSNYLEWMQVICRGSTRDRVSRTVLGDLCFIYPSTAEQKEIVEFLDEATARLDLLKTKTDKQIELLKEYRTSLITAAVTGQIKIISNMSKDYD